MLTFEHSYTDNPYAYLFSVYNGETFGAFIPGTRIPKGRDEVANNSAAIYTERKDYIFLNAKYDFSWATLTSNTGFQSYANKQGFDIDGTHDALGGALFGNPSQVLTQEFDLSSSGSGPFQWVVGVFAMNWVDYTSHLHLSIFGSPFRVASTTGQTTNSYAGFADATYRLTDQLFITLGGRYGVDQISAIQNAERPSTSFNSFTPRAVLRYQFLPNTNVYASVSQGEKSGLFNTAATPPTIVQPEKLTAYEIGVKTAQPMWQFEASTYLYNYTNLQVTALKSAVVETLNAASAQIYGVEGHLRVALTDNLSLDATAAYNHAQYTSFPNAPQFVFVPGAGVETISVNAAGKTMERSPTFSANVGVTYSHEAFGGTFVASANYSYQTEVFFDFADTERQPAYGLLNLRAAWTSPDKLTVALYAKNVSDQSYITQVIGEAPFALLDTWGAPSTYGVEISKRF
jgi:iron complex outermembrane receptor protein